MNNPWADDQDFQSPYYVTLILRLVFNDETGLERGELINADGTLRQRFRDLDGLLHAVAKLVNRHDT
jgi:hypothetical protein